MQEVSTGVSAARETVARFRSMETGWEFLISGTQHDDGFELDAEVQRWAGPFATFADGTSAKFLGLDNLRLV